MVEEEDRGTSGRYSLRTGCAAKESRIGTTAALPIALSSNFRDVFTIGANYDGRRQVELSNCEMA
jgi:hypothetical protein